MRKSMVFLTAAIAIASMGCSNTQASQPVYKSFDRPIGTLKFADLKCVGPIAEGLKVDEVYKLRDRQLKTPKGGSRQEVLVAVKAKTPSNKDIYILQGIDYRKGQKCVSFFSLYDDDEEYAPLHLFYSDKDAVDIQYLWGKWQDQNVPGWRKAKLAQLAEKKVYLATEEAIALRKLGIKVPKNYREVKRK